jgi:hypothetical protein
VGEGEGERTGRAGVLSEKPSGGAEYCDGQGTADGGADNDAGCIAPRSRRRGTRGRALRGATGQREGSHNTGARLIAGGCRPGGGGGDEALQKRPCACERVVNGAMMIHHE